MGMGTEIIFLVALGGLVLGPRRLHAMIGHVARAKARFEEITHAVKSQLIEELDAEYPERPKSSA